MKPIPGSLLIAPPNMTDTRFSKSVLLVTHHNSQGTFALCLNRPTSHSLASLKDQLELDKELPFQLYWGGPVNHGTIWMLHDDSWESEHTIYVDAKWRVTSHMSMFHHMADGDCPRTFRLVYGFASWAPGQLEMELKGVPPFNKESSWIFTGKSEPEWVFETDVDSLWADSTELAGNQAIDTWL